jgi:hypothetical protein
VYLGNKPLSGIYREACAFLKKVIREEGLFSKDPDEVRDYFTNLMEDFMETMNA